MAIANMQTSAGAVGSPASSNKVALSVVTTLFLMWGFVTVLNDVLVPHLKSIFDLNYTRVMLIQFAFFSAYFLFSIPSAKVIDWISGTRRPWWRVFSPWVWEHCCSFPLQASRPIRCFWER